jgi:hypothetical protein
MACYTDECPGSTGGILEWFGLSRKTQPVEPFLAVVDAVEWPKWPDWLETFKTEFMSKGV